jgi:SP family general alpha glucoside:H+ symporter-like MFS transporter
LLKITSQNSGVAFNVDDQVQMIKATNELEAAMSEDTSYLACFKGIDARRTEIACVAWVAQAFCGAALMGYSVQFYERAGLSNANAFNMNIGQYVMGAIGTGLSWFLMTYVGRRKIYFYGLLAMLCLLLIVGGLGTMAQNEGASWGIGSILLVYTFIYDFTVGPVCYCIVAEIPSTRLKIKTVVLARNFYNMVRDLRCHSFTYHLLTQQSGWDYKQHPNAPNDRLERLELGG